MSVDSAEVIARAKQAHAAISEAYTVADKAWSDALKAVAELATAYGIDPAGVYVKSAYEDSDETRLVACGWDGYDHGLHEELEVVDRFVSDVQYLLNNSMFVGFFHRDADEEGNRVKVVAQ